MRRETIVLEKRSARSQQHGLFSAKSNLKLCDAQTILAKVVERDANAYGFRELVVADRLFKPASRMLSHCVQLQNRPSLVDRHHDCPDSLACLTGEGWNFVDS
jgi:hypothetical protein